eukprot:gene220-282_t
MADLIMGGGHGGGINPMAPVDPLGGAPRFCGDKVKFSAFRTKLVAWLMLSNGPGGKPMVDVIRNGVSKAVSEGGAVVGVNDGQREYLYHLLVLLVSGPAAGELEIPEGGATDGFYAFYKLQEYTNPSRGQPRIQKILSLLKTKCTDTTPTGIKAYMDTKRKLAKELKQITLKELLVAGCLPGLPEEFRVTKDTLLSRGLEHLSADIIEVAVLDKADAVDTEMQIVDANAAAASNSNNNGNSSALQCGYCGKKGHCLLDCRKRTADQSQGGNKSGRSYNNNNNNNKQNSRDGNSTDKEGCWTCGSSQHRKADCPKNKAAQRLGLREVLCHPELRCSLLSVPQLTADGCACRFQGEKCYITKPNGEIVVCAREGNLWRVGVEFYSSRNGSVECGKGLLCCEEEEAAKGLLVSKALRHARGMHFWQDGIRCSCDACLSGKGAKPAHQKARSDADYKGSAFNDLVSWDHQGPLEVESLGNKAKYVLLGIDDATDWCEAFPHKQRNDNFRGLRDWASKNLAPSRVRTDNAPEFRKP